MLNETSLNKDLKNLDKAILGIIAHIQYVCLKHIKFVKVKWSPTDVVWKFDGLQVPRRLEFTSKFTTIQCACPSFSSIAVRRGTTPFTALSTIYCGTADTCCLMASFNVGSDGGLLRLTFDFKNPPNQKTQGVRSRDLGSMRVERID
ncbi:hypothetical protein AVEN_65319-1 [Araneus ventricosus]|uniref:Uncharacterized protein n=1 Tax=Araneus ventricosus TaxID=182803 RepID=A0A4Y2AHL4_ARAVE|nr:hypothetical protein AVEN_65319-1 [Araneus ventricosus]